MVIIKDWKKYLTLEEAKILSNEKIKKNAKKFAKKVIKMQKQNNLLNEVELCTK